MKINKYNSVKISHKFFLGINYSKMYLEIIKNPIVLGVLAGAITYLYLVWSADKKKGKKKSVSLFMPIIVAIIVMILAYLYFGRSTEVESVPIPTNQIPIVESVLNDLSEPTQLSSASYHLVSKGINIPNNIKVPDVFIETY